MAPGLGDWQTVLELPAATVEGAFTVTVALPVISAEIEAQFALLNVAIV